MPETIFVGEVDPNLDSDDAVPGARARCVDCGETLIAKCGQINVWHWAHEAGGTMCVGSGQESAWHAAWKQWAANTLDARTEVPDGKHHADIVTPDGQVYELQSTYLDATTIAARERQYGHRLTWVYRWVPGRWARLRNVGEGWFQWKRPAMSMTTHHRPVIWHHNDRLYDITFHPDTTDGVRIRFDRGDDDKYGPTLYGSRPAPFDVADALGAFARFTAENRQENR